MQLILEEGQISMRKQSKCGMIQDGTGGGGALANFLVKFVKSEEFVGVAHSAEQ